MSEIKTAGTQRYTVPWVDGTLYKTENSSIADGVSNRAVTLTGLTRITGLEIANDNSTTGQDLTVKLNANTNDSIIIKAGEIKSINNFVMTSIYLSNSCGATINYRITAYGV